ncbi:uncharacterized protein CDAR_448601 [Caerostris darwini]|uniref:Uncharacterized protein n=1 Tax=Caerostris darwini TaxID=1538125 RepID=A0AAV4QPI6_9ARAC|nr:uncharacterized protein CDAR_448601 [Caerostris darwini]
MSSIVSNRKMDKWMHLPLQTELETPDIERTRTFVASPTDSFCHSPGATVIVKQRTSPDDRSPSSVSIAIRHTDV